MSSKTTYYCDICDKEFSYHDMCKLRGSVDFQMPSGQWVNVKINIRQRGKFNSSDNVIDVCAECRKPFIQEYAIQFGGPETR